MSLSSTNGGSSIDEVSADHARFYAIVPKPRVLYNAATVYETIECGIYNTSYVVNLTFENGLEDVNITKMTQLNGVSSD